MNILNLGEYKIINQMKNIFFILTSVSLIILVMSCENKKVHELEAKINELKEFNTKLTDSIHKMKIEKLTSLLLVGIPKNNKLIPGKPIEYNFVFHSIQDLPPFNVYVFNDKKENKIIYEDYKKSRFTYNFIPETKEDQSFNLKAFFSLGTSVIEIPALIGNKKLTRQIERMDSIERQNKNFEY